MKLYGIILYFLLFFTAQIASAENIPQLLKARGYPEHTWVNIQQELDTFLVKIDFSGLKNKARQAQESPEALKSFVAQLGLSIKQQGYLNLQEPHPLIKLLVNSLSDQDILSTYVRKKEVFACSAISQLASIIFDLLGIDAGIIITPEHVFNGIPLGNGQVLFADFSNEIFEIVDVGNFYRDEGKYKVLKEGQRLPAGQALYINKQWNKGSTPAALKEILNLDLYFYIHMAGHNAATAIIYTNLANDDEFRGYFKKALANYARALKVNPDIDGIYCDRGLAFADNGMILQALTDYDKALEINPNDAIAYNNRGLIYKDLGYYLLAIKNFDKAIKIKPNAVHIYDNRGNAYSEQRRYAQGILNYTKAIDIDPDDARGYTNRAIGYYYLKQYDKSWEDVHTAEGLGSIINPEIIRKLQKNSGRDK